MTEQSTSLYRMRKTVKIVLPIMLILLAAYFGRSLFFNREPVKRIDTGVDGRDISYLAFNEENKKSIEVKCQESFAKGEGELFLKKISAIIYKSGKMNQDIHFFSDQGLVKNDFNYFQIQGKARIVSEDFTIHAEHFLMTGKSNLFSNEKTLFTGKNISGIAQKGIEFLFTLNEFKFFAVLGKFSRKNQKMDFNSRMLWIFKEKDEMALKGNSSITTADSSLSGDEIIMRFRSEFADLQSYVSLGNSFLHSEKSIPGNEAGPGEVLEIKANIIESLFNENGELERIMIFEKGRLKIGNGSNQCEISGDGIDCWFFPQTQNISEIIVNTPGEIQSRGSQNVSLSAGRITFVYGEKGELKTIRALRNVQFTFGDFKGSAPKLELDAENNKLEIEGQGAQIKTGANLFTGASFIIDTKKNQLSAPRGVTATVLLDKGNVLFHASPLYLAADNLEMNDHSKNIAFKKKVRLFQGETKLTAGEINFNNRKKLIVAQGQAHLEFVNGKERIVLEGAMVTFDSNGRQIMTQGDARLVQHGNTLKAGKITLLLSEDERLQTVSAQDGVVFANDKISGKSEWLSWEFETKNMLFKNEAQISRKNSGTTRGRELRLNLDSNEIMVTGADDRSETTIRHDGT